ncbi:hypothetical protein AVEN_142081-1 [Araneus ventricosus]|uniref:Uncharacterized protein n=1 Tax=Araneus ventricosus TaxID=182803 RepID=A0A4Y2BLU9_ARAVE|nr:hypothetical protein AVEN_28155-1 [Araneus ventricosus]GBL93048.1 hypothetical protein AVEN_142081-1 [Araneus ventricosus]
MLFKLASRLWSFLYNAFCDGSFGESIGFLYTPIANTGFYPSNKSISILCEKGLDVSDKLMRGMRIKQHVKSAVECGTSFLYAERKFGEWMPAQVSSSSYDHCSKLRGTS